MRNSNFGSRGGSIKTRSTGQVRTIPQDHNCKSFNYKTKGQNANCDTEENFAIFFYLCPSTKKLKLPLSFWGNQRQKITITE